MDIVCRGTRARACRVVRNRAKLQVTHANGASHVVQHRFREFRKLHDELVAKSSWKIAFPASGMMPSLLESNLHPDVVSRRVAGLQGFMDVAVAERGDHPLVCAFLAAGEAPSSAPAWPDAESKLRSATCPITQELMQDPVICADGHTYEREAIERWLQSGNKRSPLTNEVLKNRELVPNHAMRGLITEAAAELRRHEEEALIREQPGPHCMPETAVHVQAEYVRIVGSSPPLSAPAAARAVVDMSMRGARPAKAVPLTAQTSRVGQRQEAFDGVQERSAAKVVAPCGSEIIAEASCLKRARFSFTI